MTKLQSGVLFLFAAVLSASAMAEDYVRDGHPCLSGICVGDDISTLSKIKWLPATYAPGKTISSLKLTAKDVAPTVNKHFASGVEATASAAAPYLIHKAFDGDAIPKLAKVKGFCDGDLFSEGGVRTGIKGIFNSDSGFRTMVFIDVFPGADPATQSLRVTEIWRWFPREYSDQQINEVSKQLEERYSAVKMIGGSRTEATWSFDPSMRLLQLRAPFGDAGKIAEQLKQYPGCTKTVKID